MASTKDHVSSVEGSASTATLASPYVSSISNEPLSETGGQKSKNTCKTAEESSKRASKVGGGNAAQVSTQKNIKTKKQLGRSGPSRNILSASATALTEGTALVGTEGTGSGLPSAVDLPQEPKNITLDNLRKLRDSTDLAQLEAAVETAEGISDAIRLPIADCKQLEQLEWLKAIDKLKNKSKRTRTVVAVAGSTGAGKSSLVNSVLDEVKILPTSGFRACTAVITEISYNEVDDPQRAYRAEVEFISQDDWASELELLFGDLVDGKQLSSAYLDANTEAGIAYAKIRAVYPGLTHDMIAKSKPERLANRRSVSNALGTTREIACRNAEDLYSELQVYLDSKDKDTKGGARNPQYMAFWPLIKVVRVYCKSAALSTGVVLVDLPGIHDANAARSAVASRYMAECSAIWVAASIRRAVDDKAAKELLGRGSRLQLKLDGIYSNVTFICTMTDEIQLSESVEAFDEDGQIKAFLSREDEIDTAIGEKIDTVSRTEQLVNDMDLAYEDIKNELSIWRGLEKRKTKGEQVYPPRVPTKRKRPAKDRRRQQTPEDDPESDDIDRAPLTTEEISSKLTELRAKARSKDYECTKLENGCEEMKSHLINLQTEKEIIAEESIHLCVQRRNQHVKDAIRVDFVAGIREIDDEDAQADEETFDPSIKRRDYDEVARSLPVYCISSKAYQQLCGRTKREARAQGFKHILDTEIPLLQDHAKKLPEKGRILALKTFLTEFCRILNSLTIWVTSSALGLEACEMSKQDQGHEIQHLQTAAEDLKRTFSTIIMALKVKHCKIRQEVFDTKSTVAMAHASKVIDKTVTMWTTKQEEGGHGIAYSTFRATCHRNGARTRLGKSRDFNEDIQEPYLLKFASGWEHAFSELIPASLDELAITIMENFKEFHRTMLLRPKLRKGKTIPNVIGRQVENHGASIEDMVNSMKASIQAEQRHANRTFLPEIRREMEKAYSHCAAQKGKGCFQRMKDHMLAHVTKNKSAIYRKASQRVIKDLDKLFDENCEEMEYKAHHLVDVLEDDYRTFISSSEVIEASETIRDILYQVDLQFEKVLRAEQMDVDPAQSSQPAP